MPRNPDMIQKQWNETARKHLVGRKVTGARYLTPTEAQNIFGFDGRAVALEFDDGSYVFPSQDDEGNGPGALFGTDSKGNEFTLPVIS